MATIVIDTNAYTKFMAGVAQATVPMSAATLLVVPFPVIAELRAGFLNGSRTAANMANLQTFLSARTVEVAHSSATVVSHYAELWLFLKQRGSQIPQNDLWIAAVTLALQLPLLTFDHHFDHLPQHQRV